MREERTILDGPITALAMQKFPDGGRYFTGNRCERGAGGEKKDERKVPNIYAFKYSRLFDYYKPAAQAPRGRIGIPRVLNMGFSPSKQSDPIPRPCDSIFKSIVL